MSLVYWLPLLCIAVSDLKYHKIPNSLLLLILSVRVVELIAMQPSLGTLRHSAGLFLLMFGFGLVCYFLRAMAPGDVKLLAVIGFILGGETFTELGFWLLIGSGLTAGFYLALKLASQPPARAKSSQLKPSLAVYILRWQQWSLFDHLKKQPLSSLGTDQTVVMPMAPALVIGLALYHYFVV
jgi:prepilin peptidase CpaA